MPRRSMLVLALVFLAGAVVALGGFFLVGRDRAHAAGSTYPPAYGMMGGSYSGGMGPGMTGGATGTGTGHGPGMMGSYSGSMGPGMMRGAFGGGSVQSSVTTDELRAVRARVEQQLSTWGYKGFTVGEIMAFTNNDYVLVKDPKGTPAFELVADPKGRWLMPEPTMMWNAAFGMMRGVAGSGFGMMGSYGCSYSAGANGSTTSGSPLSPAAAKTRANAWLAQNRSGETTADATPLPGYYTIDVTKSGGKIGMLSVNAKTGAVWFHTWHGNFLVDQDF